MELSFLSENIIPVPYVRGDQTLELQVNIDAFTPEFWRAMKARAEEKYKALEAEIRRALKEPIKAEVKERKAKKLTKAQQIQKAEREIRAHIKQQLDTIEGQAKQLEAERETNIEFLLPYVLKGWNATENGVPVKLTKEVLMTLPPRLIQEIFDLCVKAAKTVKKRVDEEEEETSDNMPSGSRVPRLQAVAPAS